MDKHHTGSFLKRLLLFVAMLLLVASNIPSHSYAQGSGTVIGRVVNGTADGPTPQDLEVVLHRFHGEDHEEQVQTRTDADGKFSFSGLDTGAEQRYLLTIAYLGVSYAGEVFRFDSDGGTREIEVEVYETTEENPGLQIALNALIINAEDSVSRTLQVFELVSLVNPGDRTYVPDATGPAGPMALVRFALPAGARDLVLGPAIDLGPVIQVDRGFAVATPILPGTQEVAFRYHVPYQGGEYYFERSVPYPVEMLRLLVPENVALTEGLRLTLAADTELGAQRYRVWESRNLGPGERVEFSLGNLPKRFFWDDFPLPQVPDPVWGGLGVALALAIAGGYAMRRRNASSMADSDIAAYHPEVAQWLDHLAEMDDGFAAGVIPQPEYEEQRAAGKAALFDRWMKRNP